MFYRLLLAKIAALAIYASAAAQVGSVNYQMKYDNQECTYGCYLIINEGSAETSIERTAFNAQFSVIAPTGSTLSISEFHNPTNYVSGSGYPAEWTLADPVISPAADPENDYYRILPQVLSAYIKYDTLYANDTIHLFDLDIEGTAYGEDGPRLYINGIDLPSDAEGMGGSNFENGFSIGSIVDIYSSNSDQEYQDNYAYSTESSVSVGSTLQVFPTNGGTWTTSDSSIGAISYTGLLTGVSVGDVDLTFTPDEGSCPTSIAMSITPEENEYKVAVGTTSPQECAKLEIKNEAKGLKIPTLTLSQKLNIPSPADGLLIYQSNHKSGFYAVVDGQWSLISTPTNTPPSSNGNRTNKTDIATMNVLKNKVEENQKLISLLAELVLLESKM